MIRSFSATIGRNGLLLTVLALTVALITAGCGSGGSGSNNGTLTGTAVTNPNSTPAANYSVVLDGNAATAVTTTSNGTFTFLLPHSEIFNGTPPTHTLTFSTPGGQPYGSVDVTVTPAETSGNNVALGTLTIGPPVAPFVRAN